MKFLIPFLFLILGVKGVSGQESERNKRAHTAFIEVGGNGVLISLNYDFRFAKKQSGLGARVGGGYTWIFSRDRFAIPLGLNYLAGNGPHYLEGGLGLTIARFDDYGDPFYLDKLRKSKGAVLVPSIGYRHQPLHSGLTGRVFISPFIGGGAIVFWAGISGGIRI